MPRGDKASQHPVETPFSLHVLCFRALSAGFWRRLHMTGKQSVSSKNINLETLALCPAANTPTECGSYGVPFFGSFSPATWDELHNRPKLGRLPTTTTLSLPAAS